MTMLDQNLGATDVAGLVRRAAEGDQEAWERLIEQYSRLIWSITVDFKLPESDAADVVQTTWLRLLEHIDRIEHPDRVGSWLAATARNACLRSLAARKRLVLGDEDADLEDATRHEPEIDEHLLASERAQTVQDAVLPAHAVATAARTAHGRSADFLHRDLGPTRSPYREHRPYPQPVPGEAAHAAGNFLTAHRRTW